MRIVIIEPDDETTGALRLSLGSQPDLDVIHSFKSLEEAEEPFEKLLPDVALVDHNLPGVKGASGLHVIHEASPSTQIIMLTVESDPSVIFKALCNGAVGYVVKSRQLQELPSAIREVVSGGAAMTPSVARALLERIQKVHGREERPFGLTGKQMEVARLISKGLLIKEVASELGVVDGTVKKHIHKIYRKLEVTHRAAALKKLGSVLEKLNADLSDENGA